MNNKVSSFITRATALALFASPVCIAPLQSQEVYSQIVGAIAVDVPAESDVVLAFPFKRSASFRGGVESSAAEVVTVGDGVLTAGEFTPENGEATHFLYVESGTLKGRRFDIVSNTVSGVTLDQTPTGLAQNDEVSIREHWTLSEAFPQGVGFVEEVEAGLREVEVIIPEQASIGGGLAAERVFYFYADAWREVGKPLTSDVGGTAFGPGTAIVVRNNGSESLRTYFFGEVVDTPLAIPVVSNAAESVDNLIGFEIPLEITLTELNAIGNLADVLEPEDRLLVYSRSGKNPEATAYQYTGTQWQQEGSTADAGATKILAGEGLAIRKAAGADDTTYLVNEWSLPN